MMAVSHHHVASSDDNVVWSGAGIGSGIFWTINMRPTSVRTCGTGSSYAVFSGGATRNRDFENNPSVLAAPNSEMNSGRGVDFVIARWFDDLHFNGIFVSIPSPAILKTSSLGFSLKRFATEDFLTDAREGDAAPLDAGDGLVAGLQVLARLVATGLPASEALRMFDPLPQVLRSVKYSGGAPLEAESVRSVIAASEARLNGSGRLVIRKSGTEPVVRVMAEGEDPALVNAVVDEVCEAVRQAA